MRSLKNFFLGKYANRGVSETTRAKHLSIFNWLFIGACLFLIPINISTGDKITLSVLPLCIALTLFSQLLITKRKLAFASNLSLIACLAAITLDLFVTTEPPGINLLYRGLLTYMVVMIASPLVFGGKNISIMLGLFTVGVLVVVYYVRINPVVNSSQPIIPEVANMILLFGISIILNYFTFRTNQNLIALLEDENIRMHLHQQNLEYDVHAKSAQLSNALEQLRKKEELYRSIVENSHDGIVIIDDRGIVVFVNSEMCRLIGYSPEEITGRNFLDFVDKESRGIAEERYKKRQKGESVPSVYETTLIGKSGAKVRGEVRVVLFATPDDRLQSVVQFLDITDRKRSENTLAMLHDLAIKLGGIIEAEQAMDLIMDALLRIDEVDCGGLYIRNLVTGDIALACHRGLSKQFVDAVSYLPNNSLQVKLLQKGTPIHLQFQQLAQQFSEKERITQSHEGICALASIPLIYCGELIGALNAASHIHNEFSETAKSVIEALAAQVSAVVARLRAETALRESERKYRSLVEQTDSIFYTADPGGIITYISPSVQNHTGYTPSEVLGHQFIHFIHPDDVEKILTKYNELIHGILGPDEYRLVAKDGTPVWIISNSQPIIVDGNLKGIIGVFTNISERKKREEERLEIERKLLHSQKLESLGVLTGGIAHDFNNLLMAMMGNIELAGLHLENDAPAKKFLSEAHLATKRASDLIRQMLIYSGKVQQNLQIIRIGKAVEDILALVKSSISKKALFNAHLDGDKNPIRADITQIQQIAMNLVINASEALEEGSGEITVESGEMHCDKHYLEKCRPDHNLAEGTYAFLEVRDTGCGIPKENLERIFDPFFTTKFTGRGLGMAAVLGIIRAHSGAILIESKPGKGTKARVLFPIAEHDPTEETTGEKNKPSPETNTKHTLLLVDDDESVLQTGSSMLQVLGYSVIQAHNGKEAIALFRQSSNIDCAIIDLSMPHMDGREVLEEIKKINPAAICILTSGHPEEDVMRKGKDDSAEGFLQKPFALEDLKKKLDKILKTS